MFLRFLFVCLFYEELYAIFSSLESFTELSASRYRHYKVYITAPPVSFSRSLFTGCTDCAACSLPFPSEPSTPRAIETVPVKNRQQQKGTTHANSKMTSLLEHAVLVIYRKRKEYKKNVVGQRNEGPSCIGSCHKINQEPCELNVPQLLLLL